MRVAVRKARPVGRARLGVTGEAAALSRRSPAAGCRVGLPCPPLAPFAPFSPCFYPDHQIFLVYCVPEGVLEAVGAQSESDKDLPPTPVA